MGTKAELQGHTGWTKQWLKSAAAHCRFRRQPAGEQGHRDRFGGAASLPPFIATLALELAPIRVNLIAAGFVDTPLSASLLGDRLEERRSELRAKLPIGRGGDRRGRRRSGRSPDDQYRVDRRHLRHRR
jgi:hypothetical protein